MSYSLELTWARLWSTILPMSTPILTLREAVDYDPETGLFLWRERPIHHFKNDHRWSAAECQRRWNTSHAGTSALRSIGPNGYFYGRIDAQHLYAHRAALAWVMGAWPSETVDHINGVKTDNRLANLRDASRSEQARNKSAHTDSTSRYLGVSLRRDRGLWRAVIFHEGKQQYLGTFASEEDAARAYDKAASEKFGRFARLNFPLTIPAP